VKIAVLTCVIMTGVINTMNKIIFQIFIQPNLLDYRHLVNEVICAGVLFA